MDTVKTDDNRRVVIPDAHPGQMFAFKNNGDGTRTLTEITPIEPLFFKTELIKDEYGVLVMHGGKKITSEDIRKAIAEEFP